MGRRVSEIGPCPADPAGFVMLLAPLNTTLTAQQVMCTLAVHAIAH